MSARSTGSLREKTREPWVPQPELEPYRRNTNDTVPDGGLRAWLVVFGSVCNCCATFGFVNAWGVFQSYYETSLLHGHSPSDIAWIGSIQYCLAFFPGIIVGHLFDLGYFNIVLAISSVVLVLSTFLIAQCTEYWHFVLCQGIGIGLASGGIFAPTMSVLTQWFDKKRGFAYGIVTVGSSIGGTVIPLIVRALIPHIGFKYTIRVLAAILFVLIIIVNLTVRTRRPRSVGKVRCFDLRCFRSAAFSIYCFSTFCVFLGIYTLLTFAGSSAILIGLPESSTFWLVAIANASSGLGRAVAGLVADSLGSINVMAPMTALAAILTIMWPHFRNESSFIVLMILYGLSSGVYLSVISGPIVDMGQSEDVGKRVGLIMTILSIGALVGPPTSGAIYARTGNFDAVGVWAGSIVLFGVSLMILTKRLWTGTLRGIF